MAARRKTMRATSSSTADKDFKAALSRIDLGRVRRDMKALRGVLKSSTALWQLVEPTVARVKLNGTISPSEERILLTLVRQAAKQNRRSLELVRRFIRDTLKPSGILNVVVSGARHFAPKVALKSLPPFDAAELRAAGLTDVEVLRLLRIGIAEYRTTIVRTRKVDFSEREFTVLAARLRSIEKWSRRRWHRDIFEGNSGWEVFWDAVKMVAGGVIVGANILGATETAGATVLSIASGVGLYASGAHDLKKDSGN